MSKFRNTLFSLLAAAVLIFSGCFHVSFNTGTTTTETTPELSAEPTEAPSAKAVHFSTTALDGTPVTQDFFKDHKVNFVHYWATWCGPCVGELPSFPELYEKYKDRVGFMAVVDQDGAESAQKILDDSKVTFLNVGFFPEVTDIFGTIQYVPCTILVDDSGAPLTDQIVGAVGVDEYSRRLDEALAAAAE
jgi:thiol-disulfide isomerase/thioredoxin